jgi:hypothetical protein
MSWLLFIFRLPKGIQLTETGKKEWLDIHILRLSWVWCLGTLFGFATEGYIVHSKALFDSFHAGDWFAIVRWLFSLSFFAIMFHFIAKREAEELKSERKTVLAIYEVRYYYRGI